MVMDKRVLPREIKSLGVNTRFLKYLVILMESFKCVIQFFETVRVYNVTSGNVDEVDQGMHHFRGYVAFNSRQIDLHKYTLAMIIDYLICYELTFMRAFESLLVHCLKPLPSGNRHSPAKGGARAMLDSCISHILGQFASNKHTVGQYHQVFDWPAFPDVEL
jgi:hypothetical protein